MKVKTLIVDDEALARHRIRNLLKERDDIAIIGECKNGTDAIAAINSKRPELLFLDIQMKDMTGFDVLEKKSDEIKPLIIFVTAYDQHALKAFDFFALDYLLKPYKDERFYKSLDNAILLLKNAQSNIFEENIEKLLQHINKSNDIHKAITTRLPVKLGNKITFINTSEIKYILASGYYAEIYTNDKKYLLREPLSSLIENLNAETFIRIHRSTIINVKELSEVISSNYGELDVKMKDAQQFRISKSYKKDFLRLMKL